MIGEGQRLPERPPNEKQRLCNVLSHAVAQRGAASVAATHCRNNADSAGLRLLRIFYLTKFYLTKFCCLVVCFFFVVVSVGAFFFFLSFFPYERWGQPEPTRLMNYD